MNRNHFFMVGLVVLMLGIQIHLVESYVLTEKATRVLAKSAGKPDPPQSASLFLPAVGPNPLTQKSLKPPEWLGWLLMSVGTVFILHSWAMPKPT